MQQQLYKSRKSKVVDGVCGGIAEYFKVDAVIIRLIWVLAIIMGAGFFGVIAYLIAMVIIPRELRESSEVVNEKNQGDKELEEIDSEERKRKFSLLLGLILIGVGGFLLIERFVGINVRFWISNTLGNFWPVLLIGLGIFLLSKRSSW